MTKNKRRLIAVIVICIVFITAFAIMASAEDTVGAAEPQSRFYKTFWSLLPPIIAIALALITKEVYTSLFVGIIAGVVVVAAAIVAAVIVSKKKGKK